MYLAKSKELFCYKGCKFAFVGVDQTLRRPLTVLLFEIAVEDRTTSKILGQFQKAKLRLRRLFLLRFKTHHRPTPAPLRVTKSAQCFWLKCNFAMPTSKTAKAVFIGFCSVPRGQPAGLVCSEVTKSAHDFRLMRSIVTPTSKTAMAVFGTAVRYQVGVWLLISA